MQSSSFPHPSIQELVFCAVVTGITQRAEHVTLTACVGTRLRGTKGQGSLFLARELLPPARPSSVRELSNCHLFGIGSLGGEGRPLNNAFLWACRSRPNSVDAGIGEVFWIHLLCFAAWRGRQQRYEYGDSGPKSFAPTSAPCHKTHISCLNSERQCSCDSLWILIQSPNNLFVFAPVQTSLWPSNCVRHPNRGLLSKDGKTAKPDWELLSLF